MASLLPLSLLVRRRSVLLQTSTTFSRYITCKKSITEILRCPGPGEETRVLAKGWVKSVRKHKDVVFLHINDGSGIEALQIVCDLEIYKKSKANYGSSVAVEGVLVESPAAEQRVELRAEKVMLFGACDPEEYPFKARKKHSPDYIRGYLHLRPRTKFFSALLRIRNAATMAVHNYFQENGFCFVHTPLLTSNDCEGAGEVFQVEPAHSELATKVKRTAGQSESQSNFFFNNPTYLTVSGQLHLEAITGAFHKAYSFGPTFRAENSHGRHHLSEFYMIEAEMAYINELEDLMKVVEEMVKYISKRVMDQASSDVEFFNKNLFTENQEILKILLDSKFHRISYDEAIKLLERQEHFKFKVKWGSDLQKEHEKFLVKELGNVPVFVHDFPRLLKPFYARDNEDQETVAAADLLAPRVGELVGGSIREDRLDVLLHKLDEFALGQQEHIQWYLDLRRFGSVTHGGFGLGFERYLQYLLGIQNIRDTIPFPRYPQHCMM